MFDCSGTYGYSDANLELLCDELGAVVTSYVARLTIEPYHFLKDIADKVD